VAACGPQADKLGVVEQATGHAFVSYVREDAHQVGQLQQVLEAHGIPVWRDTADLWPGQDWRWKIRQAITGNALVFIACFSSRSTARSSSFQYEELVLAIEQLRLRSPDVPWLIPVRFDDCAVPDLEIGGGRTVGSIQRADLFGNQRDTEILRLLAVVRQLLGLDLAEPDGGVSLETPDTAPKWVARTSGWLHWTAAQVYSIAYKPEIAAPLIRLTQAIGGDTASTASVLGRMPDSRKAAAILEAMGRHNALPILRAMDASQRALIMPYLAPEFRCNIAADDHGGSCRKP